MSTAGEAGTGRKQVLQFLEYKKQYRGHSGTWEKDFVADLLFSLRDADDPGATPVTFWCEARLRHDLASRGEWKNLSKHNRFRALYLAAIEAIRNAGGRPVRHVTLNWQPSLPHAEGPGQDLSDVRLLNPPPVTIEGDGIQPVVVHQH